MAPSVAVKIPRSRLPPLTENPTAVALSLAGGVTVPKVSSVESSFSTAPLPMYNSALRIDSPSRLPFRSNDAASSGSSTPEIIRWLKSTVALPYTTLAMAKPAEPPIRSVGESLVSARPATDRDS